MAYKLPKNLKWKGRKSQRDIWSYFKTKEDAEKFAEDNRFVKRVKKGT